MEFKTLFFYMFAAVMVLASLMVITAKNPVHAVLYLVLAFFNASGIWLLLQAEFLAIALIVVYVGAVMVLFLFVVMMLDINMETVRKGFWAHFPFAITLGVLMLSEMIVVLSSKYSAVKDVPVAQSATYSNTKELGRSLFTEYAYPLEIASVILLVGLIAAIMLTHRERKESKAVHPSEQLKVKRNDRLRIVKMDAVRDDLNVAKAEE